MELDELIRDFCQREIVYKCYDACINDISIYSVLRRDFRVKIEEQEGLVVMQGREKISKSGAILATLKSGWHLIKLLLSGHKYHTAFCAFPRVDKIDGLFLDKFTDPVIEECGLKNGYLIFDHGFAGIHPKPRLHDKNLIYWDFLHVIAKLYSHLLYKSFYKSNQKQFDLLFESLEKAFGSWFDKMELIRTFMSNYAIICMFRLLWRRISVKRVIGPARPFTLFAAAKLEGIATIELQHGITYGETELYSGYRDPLFIPDLFMAFGENRPLDVYGIDESKIINIGWALGGYISRLRPENKLDENDVLVVSEPEVTDKMVKVTIDLAEKFPKSVFWFRPHPHERIGKEQEAKLTSVWNIRIQDKRINITEAMASLKHVMGENSTVLYEALSEGKKVAKLFIGGLSSLYLQPEDKECFWEIHRLEDFGIFLEGDISTKRRKSIYSSFDKETFFKYLD